jgi:hypothetical protein
VVAGQQGLVRSLCGVWTRYEVYILCRHNSTLRRYGEPVVVLLDGGITVLLCCASMLPCANRAPPSLLDHLNPPPTLPYADPATQLLLFAS